MNDQIILIGISDAATEEDKCTATYSDMHLFCEKPLDTQILNIVLDSRRNYCYQEALTKIKHDTNKLLDGKTSLIKKLGKSSLINVLFMYTVTGMLLL